MPKAKHTINGKAFEYACLKAVEDELIAKSKPYDIDSSKPYVTAKKFFDSLSSSSQSLYLKAAKTATKMLSNLEPRLIEGKGTLNLKISPDSAAIGSDGDVRDVIFSRSDAKDKWEIGISCKHNHEGLRHPRITEGKDFGKDWIGINCSKDFIDEITPIIDSLDSLGKAGVKWRDIPNKQDTYYVPILNAYLKEIQRLCAANPSAPEQLLSYFFGAKDYYKVIMKESKKTTTIEGFNMNKTLNKANGKSKPVTKMPVTKMPTMLTYSDFRKKKSGSPYKTTIVLSFDEGWSIYMRLHNKDEIARPTSLAWEVNFGGLPPTTYNNSEPWL